MTRDTLLFFMLLVGLALIVLGDHLSRRPEINVGDCQSVQVRCE